MKVLKEAKNPYIESRKRRNLLFFVLLVTLSVLLAAIGVWQFTRLLLVAWAPLAFASLFLRRYRIWKAGGKGEQAVARALQKLDDSYYLLNAVQLTGRRGDIDHVVAGRNGVFVIEAKNYSGAVLCNGDEWHRKKRGSSRTVRVESVSEQARNNAVQMRDFLRRSTGLDLDVSPICVFVNPSVQLTLKNPAVPVLRLGSLSSFIESARGKSLSKKDLEKVTQAVLRAG